MILLTGASGFVGKSILTRLPPNTRILSRSKTIDGFEQFQCDFGIDTDFRKALLDVQVVIHCAARAHVMHETCSDPKKLYFDVNTYSTLALAEQAAASGVKRFIFISSIKVNGESTVEGKPFVANDARLPQDFYGESKAMAEIGLEEISKRTGMEYVIIRPPLVYGPGVKANFAALLMLAERNLPLPFGSINNKRSLVALDNLVDLVICCINHPKAANQIFLVSDDNDISTTELLEIMTRSYGKTPFLLPVSLSLLRKIAFYAGKQALFERLCGNLQVDINSTKQTLGWSPPVTLQTAIKQCVDYIHK